MSRLQEVRLEREYSQQEIVSPLREAGYRIDSSLLSKIENDICLPTPPMADKLCSILTCTLSDLYQPEELTFDLVPKETKISPSNGLAGSKGRTERKIQFRLTEYALQVFTSGALEVCGYRTKTEWFYECVRQLEEKASKEKAARSAGTETDGEQVKQCRQAMFTSNIAQEKEVCQDG